MRIFMNIYQVLLYWVDVGVQKIGAFLIQCYKNNNLRRSRFDPF